jgi:hypothetical protein
MLSYKEFLKEESNIKDYSNFWNWFGNSKIKDKHDNPLIVFHGTDEDFEIFDRDKGRKWAGKVGFWFTDKKDMAEMFGNKILSVYLKIENPYKMTMKTFNSWREKYHNDLIFWLNKRNELVENGYDGIVIEGKPEKLGKFDVDSGSIYVTFNSNQIKSIDNVGSFNPKSNNIRENLNVIL